MGIIIIIIIIISSWLNFGRPAPPGSGSAAGRKFLARSVCVSLSDFFQFDLIAYFVSSLHSLHFLHYMKYQPSFQCPASVAFASHFNLRTLLFSSLTKAYQYIDNDIEKRKGPKATDTFHKCRNNNNKWLTNVTNKSCATKHGLQ